MEWELQLDESLRLVVVKVRGRLDGAEAQRMVTAARGASRDNGFHILYDMRDALPGLGHGEVFWMARRLGEVRGGRNTRIATLYPPEYSGTARFWEDAFRNAGIDARAFDDEASAFAWLAEKPRPSRDRGAG